MRLTVKSSSFLIVLMITGKVFCVNSTEAGTKKLTVISEYAEAVLFYPEIKKTSEQYTY